MIIQPIVFVDDPTIKIDGGGIAFSLRSRDYKEVQCVVTYQIATGTLSPGAHPGSYNGQGAWNDMLVTDDGIIMHGNRTGKRRNNEGGVSDIDG